MTSPAPVRWRYTFCDLVTKTRLAELPLTGADLAEAIGQPAAGSGTVPLASDRVRARDPWTATRPRRTVCFAQRLLYSGARITGGLQPLWAGIVWKRERSDRALKLTMSTPESYYARRLVAADRSWTATDDAVIQAQVLSDAEAAGPSLGLLIPGVLLGSVSDRQAATAELKKVLDTAQSVASAAPFEWRIEPGWDAAAARFTLTLRQAALLGRDPVSSRHLVWTSGQAGRPGNEVVGYGMTEDGTNVPNWVGGVGGQAGADAPQLRSTATSAALGPDELGLGYPLLEDGLALSDTGDVLTQATLDKHTLADLAALRAGEVQVTGLTVRGDRQPTVDSYGLGDTVTLRLADLLQPQPLQLSGRVLARRVLPREPGRNETVAMTLGVVA